MGLDTIVITKLMTPGGRTIPVTIARPSAVTSKYAELVGRGIEVQVTVRDGQMWMACLNAPSPVEESCGSDGADFIASIDRIIYRAHGLFCRVPS